MIHVKKLLLFWFVVETFRKYSVGYSLLPVFRQTDVLATTVALIDCIGVCVCDFVSFRLSLDEVCPR